MVVSPIAMDGGTGHLTDDTIRILVVDDHVVVAQALALAISSVPDLEVVGVAGDLGAARQAIVEHRPRVVLLDHRLPDGDGAGAAAELAGLGEQVSVVLLTAEDDLDVFQAALDAGCDGYLRKTASLDEIAAGVRAVVAGGSAFETELLLAASRRARREAPHERLTEREREVLALVADGTSTKAIAEELHLSLHTVRNHVRHTMEKLGAHSRLEAVAIARSQGILPR